MLAIFTYCDRASQESGKEFTIVMLRFVRIEWLLGDCWMLLQIGCLLGCKGAVCVGLVWPLTGFDPKAQVYVLRACKGTHLKIFQGHSQKNLKIIRSLLFEVCPCLFNRRSFFVCAGRIVAYFDGCI